MGVANTKSAAITNADATPRVINNAAVTKGRVRSCFQPVAVAAADDNGSVYRVARLPSNAVLLEILRRNTAITDGTDFDVGVYQTAANGGAVVNVNLFADAVDLSSASLAGVDDLIETGGDIALTDMGKMLWELLGLTADPNIDYDLAYTGVAVGTAAGTIAVRVQWAE